MKKSEFVRTLINNGWVDKGDVLVRYSKPRLGWKEDGTLIIGYHEYPNKVTSIDDLNAILGLLDMYQAIIGPDGEVATDEIIPKIVSLMSALNEISAYPRYRGNGLYEIAPGCITGEKGVELFMKHVKNYTKLKNQIS